MRFSAFSTLLATMTMLTASVAFTQPVYETDFESTGDPSGVNYTLGDLDGQDNWTVDAASPANVTNAGSPGAASGANYVTQPANSVVSRPISGNLTDRVLIRAWYFGSGSADLEVPTTPNDVAAILGFRAVDSTSIQIAAYDGVSTAFVEPPSGSLPNDQWHKITLSLRYTDKEFDVAVDNQPHLQDVNFRTNTVTSLNGFESHSSNGSSMDKLGFFFSDGDYDEDGISDDDEMRMMGADPLDPDLPGLATATPSPSPTPSPTVSPTLSPTVTPTVSPTVTGTPTITPTVTATQTPSPTATLTPIISPTATPIPTATGTPVPTTTATPNPTATPEPTVTQTPVATATATPEPTETAAPTVTPTQTAGLTKQQIAEIILNLRPFDPDADENKDEIIDAGDLVF